jgi:hypothetical protein
MSDAIFALEAKVRRLERAMNALIAELRCYHADACHSRGERDEDSRGCSCGAQTMNDAADAAEKCMP